MNDFFYTYLTLMLLGCSSKANEISELGTMMTKRMEVIVPLVLQFQARIVVDLGALSVFLF